MPQLLSDSDSEVEQRNQKQPQEDVDMSEEEDEEVGEDEYIVEEIKDHKFKGKNLQLLVKWKGYDDPNDMTWEPEENCEGAKEVVEEYFMKIGGRPEPQTGSKRGRPSATPSGADKKAKRGRVSASASAADTPSSTRKGSPADQKESQWKPSERADWEKDVETIDTVEKTGNTLVCYLHWKNGKKTQHPTEVVYRKCPQKMLKFYESHLVFKVNEHDVTDYNESETVDL